ncbi:S41 family peptidase [Sphingomonas sp.]|uniref:S41 family peptidase n=1 Tax=Sphingomonas sp. TaxID=28214 RepID=UPI002ED842A9
MTVRRFGAALCLAAVLAGCGGDNGGGSASGPVASGSGSTGSGAGGGTSATTGCSVRERQDWAAAQLREWYLFPETLPISLDPAGYADVDDYIDALTATARSQRRDRFFTYLTSIAEENAFFASGSSAGFGFRLTTDASARRLFVSEAFEGTTALAAGIDRGTEILAIGADAGTLRDVATIAAAPGGNGLNDALGPSTAGTTRAFRVADAAGTRVVTIAKTEYTLTPVSSRYGAKIIDDAGGRYGYVNLRTFIATADPALRSAFAQFRAAGVTDVIVDFRYNGGGLVSIAELMGDLLGANRSTSEVLSYTTFRPEKAVENETRTFAPQAQSIAPTRVAFIGTGGTASASELVINAFIPYLRANAGLIGTNTFGKPVGQIALDKAACDDRLRVVAFATQNTARQGNYYDGLAGTVEASCQAADDIGFPLGDPREASTRAALNFLQGRSCTRIPTGAVSTAAARTLGTPVLLEQRALLIPARPDTVQREVPGAF